MSLEALKGRGGLIGMSSYGLEGILGAEVEREDDKSPTSIYSAGCDIGRSNG